MMLRDSAFSMGCVRYSCGQMGNRLGRCQLLFVGKKKLLEGDPLEDLGIPEEGTSDPSLNHTKQRGPNEIPV